MVKWTIHTLYWRYRPPVIAALMEAFVRAIGFGFKKNKNLL